MTFEPLALPLPDPRDRAYSVRVGSRTYLVAGRSPEWTACLVSPLRGFRGPWGHGRTREAAVEACRG